MEKGVDTSCGFNVLDRKTSLNSDFLRWMKSTATGSNISIMPSHHQQTIPFTLGGGAYAGPSHKSGGPNEAAPMIYRDQVSSCGSGGGAGFNYCTTPYKSPAGGGMAFTAAQWKELERQAMIYKCMISSVHVPPHLLDSSFPSVYGGGRYSRKGDPEPGRCKRTDGKKWRCSREVAPQQKYCERHLHRGRPRSRKPVEANNNTSAPNHKKTRLHQTKTPLAPPKPNLNISTPYYNETNSLFGAGEIAYSKQPWENLMGGFGEDYPLQEAPLNLFSYPEMGLPTGFIDAWSMDNINNRSDVESSVSLREGDLSPSLDLSMAMAVGNVLDQQMRNIQCESDDDFDASKWLSPVSWEGFAGGGPLGEALQPASPYSTPATTVSSPSGVLQRTLLSHSDGSVCNSPTQTFRL